MPYPLTEIISWLCPDTQMHWIPLFTEENYIYTILYESIQPSLLKFGKSLMKTLRLSTGFQQALMNCEIIHQ